MNPTLASDHASADRGQSPARYGNQRRAKTSISRMPEITIFSRPIFHLRADPHWDPALARATPLKHGRSFLFSFCPEF
jgi:hypothetical protein